MINDVPIFSNRIINDLLNKGFILTEIQPNKKQKGKTVSYFKYEERLREYLMSEYNIKIEKRGSKYANDRANSNK